MVAREEHDVAGWEKDLETLEDLLTDENVARAFASPQLDDGRRVGLAISLAPEGFKADRVNFMKLLVLRRRTGIIGAIREEFERLVAESQGRVDLEVTTGRPLSPQTQQRIREELSRKVGRDTRVEISLDPNLLGGVVIRQGDRVTDGSVRRRLQELREQLTAI
jgi:F-type H+-transporting ATPase subunit delta